MSALPYIGKKVSIVSVIGGRYEGYLIDLNAATSTLTIGNARMFGTEGRRVDGPQIPPSDAVFESIIFRKSEIKNLKVLDDDIPQYIPPPVPSTSVQLPAQSSAPKLSPASLMAPITAPAPAPAPNLPPSTTPAPSTTAVSAASAGIVPAPVSAAAVASVAQSATASAVHAPYNSSAGYGPTSVPSYSLVPPSAFRTDPILPPPYPPATPAPGQTWAQAQLLQYQTYYGVQPSPDSRYQGSPTPIAPGVQQLPAQRPILPASLLGPVSTSAATAAPALLPPPAVSPESEPTPPSSLAVGPLADSLATVSLSKESSNPEPLLGREEKGSAPHEPTSQSRAPSLLPLLPLPSNIAAQLKDRSETRVRHQIPGANHAGDKQETRGVIPPNGASLLGQRRAGDRAPHGGQAHRGSQPHPKKFTEDFDFSAMNEKFDKGQVWGELGGKEPQEEAEEAAAEEPAWQGQEQADSGKPNKMMYSKDSFFDEISCEALDREANRDRRHNYSDQRKVDVETFGSASVRGRGGRGRGRGPYSYRGGGYGSHGFHSQQNESGGGGRGSHGYGGRGRSRGRGGHGSILGDNEGGGRGRGGSRAPPNTNQFS